MKMLLLQALMVATAASKSELAAGSTAQHIAFLITEAETGHPIQSVMDTIKATAEKGLAEGRREQELMEKFEAQSVKSQKKLSATIADNEAAKKEMEDESAAKKAENRTVSENIEATESEISKLKAAAKEAKETRDEEIKVENLTQKEHNDTVKAMKEAIAALEEDKQEIVNASKEELKATKDYAAEAEQAVQDEKAALLKADDSISVKVLSLASVRKASEFALLSLDSLSQEEQDMLASISTQEEDGDSPLAGRAPPKKQYKFKSGKVLDLLKKMQMKYEDELMKALLASKQAQMEYDLAKGARDEATEVAEAKLVKQQEHGTEVNATLIQLAADLKTTQGELDSDTKTLQERQMTLKLKKEEFKQRSYLRQREQEALAYGLQILSQVAGVRHEKPAKESLLQLESHEANINVHNASELKAHAVETIRKEAQRSGSQGLARLADQVETHMANTPAIGKEVDQVIEKQIWKLKDDQMKDDEKWQWCNATISKTEIENQAKADYIQETKDQLQSTEATIESLTEDIANAQSKIDDTQKTVHEEKMLREETRHDHEDAIRDAKDAQTACADAIKIIEKFYKDAKEKSEASALIQNSYSLELRGDDYTDDAGFEGGYTGTSTGKEPGAEILELLSTTAANFATMQAETEAQDAQDQQEFDELMTDSKKEIESRSTEISLKEQERSRLKELATEYVEGIKLSDRQKASIVRMLEDLAKECVQEEFQERKGARELEIKSLDESQAQLAEAFNYTDTNADAVTLARAASPHAMLRGRSA